METRSLIDIVQFDKDVRCEVSCAMKYCSVIIKKDHSTSFQLFDQESNQYIMSATTTRDYNSGEYIFSTLENTHLRSVTEIPTSRYCSSFLAKMIRSTFGLQFELYESIGNVLASVRCSIELECSFLCLFLFPLLYRLTMNFLKQTPIDFQLTIFHNFDNQRVAFSASTINRLSNNKAEVTYYSKSCKDTETTNLRTKPPLWNTELQSWQHSLGTRVKAASNKNFLVVQEGNEGENRSELR